MNKVLASGITFGECDVGDPGRCLRRDGEFQGIIAGSHDEDPGASRCVDRRKCGVVERHVILALNF
jgi:hypothetical protein